MIVIIDRYNYQKGNSNRYRQDKERTEIDNYIISKEMLSDRLLKNEIDVQIENRSIIEIEKTIKGIIGKL